MVLGVFAYIRHRLHWRQRSWRTQERDQRFVDNYPRGPTIGNSEPSFVKVVPDCQVLITLHRPGETELVHPTQHYGGNSGKKRICRMARKFPWLIFRSLLIACCNFNFVGMFRLTIRFTFFSPEVILIGVLRAFWSYCPDTVDMSTFGICKPSA